MATDPSYRVSRRDDPYNTPLNAGYDPERDMFAARFPHPEGTPSLPRSFLSSLATSTTDSGRIGHSNLSLERGDFHQQYHPNEHFDVSGADFRYTLPNSNSHLSAGGLDDRQPSPKYSPYANLPPADYQSAWDREGNAGDEDDLGSGPTFPAHGGGGTLSRADKFGTVELYQDDRPTSAIGSDYRGRLHMTQPSPSLNQPDRPAYSEDRIDGIQPMWSNPSFAPPVSAGMNSLPRSNAGETWRNPELQEVIEFLSSPDVRVKAHAAAYLQHLSFGNDAVKAETRALNGIQPLIELLYSDIDEVNYNAVGALRNLSYGRKNDENKIAIRRYSGLQGLVDLLKRSNRSEVREMVTAVLWNLSSLKELKAPIIDQVVPTLVDGVILPHAGLEKRPQEGYVSLQREIYWSSLFRNASGVIRNVSSDGDSARKKLRETEGLVDSLVHLVRSAIANEDTDNKSVENCVCTLRNLCYACQEISDPSYLRNRELRKQKTQQPSEVGCFGKNSKAPANTRTANGSAGGTGPPVIHRQLRGPAMGQDLLWQPHIVELYLRILSDCSNPETLEAAAGAIQNLAACEWQPSVDIRTQVRKEKGLPVMVELLNIGSDRVVCSAATALRNLAIDQRNKELIGKYGMEHLVKRLPQKGEELKSSNETIAALLATIYTVIKDNHGFASQVLELGGVHTCMDIYNTKQPTYEVKVTQFASALLHLMWNFKELHKRYTDLGLRAQHFGVRSGLSGKNSSAPPPPSLTRPVMNQSGPSARMNTLPKDKMVQRQQLPVQPPPPPNELDTTARMRPDGSFTNLHLGPAIAGADGGSYAVQVGGNVESPGVHGSHTHLLTQRELEASAQGQQLSYDVDFSNPNANGRYGDSRLGYENPGLDTGFAPEAPNSLSHGDVHVNMAGGYDNSAFLNGGPVRVLHRSLPFRSMRPDDVPLQTLTLNDYNPYQAHPDRQSVHSGAPSFNRSNPNVHLAADEGTANRGSFEPLYARVDLEKKRRFQGSQGSGLNVGGSFDPNGGLGGSVSLDVGLKSGGADSWV